MGKSPERKPTTKMTQLFENINILLQNKKTETIRENFLLGCGGRRGTVRLFKKEKKKSGSRGRTGKAMQRMGTRSAGSEENGRYCPERKNKVHWSVFK